MLGIATPGAPPIATPFPRVDLRERDTRVLEVQLFRAPTVRRLLRHGLYYLHGGRTDAGAALSVHENVAVAHCRS
jgi:hypothetical protein